MNIDPVPAKRRSGPKSKANDRTTDLIETRKELRIILERIDLAEAMQQQTRSSRRKAEEAAAINDSSEPVAAVPTAAINIEAFMPTNENYDEINDAKRLLESKTSDSADTSIQAKRGHSQFIIGCLKARFDCGDQESENTIKEESGAIEEPRIVYRAPDEMSETAKRTAAKAIKTKQKSN